MSDAPIDGTWWLASDGRWYPPQQWLGPGPVASSAADRGWWLASDGRWYPPEQHPDASHQPAPSLPPPFPHARGTQADDPGSHPGDEPAEADHLTDDEGTSAGQPGVRYKGSCGFLILDLDASTITVDRTSRRARSVGCKDPSPRVIPLAAVTGVRTISPTLARNGWLQVLHGGYDPPEPTLTSWSRTPDTIMFTRFQRREFEELAATLTTIADTNRAAGIEPGEVDYESRHQVAPTSSPATTVEVVAAADGGASVQMPAVVSSTPLSGGGVGVALNTAVPDKVSRYMKKRNALLPDETIVAAVNEGSHAVIATDRRIVIVKVGFTAGSTGGGRVTALRYRDVAAIQVQLGVLMGTLSVQSAGYGATQTGDYWALRNQQSAQELPNAIPRSKTSDKKFANELNWMRSRIEQAGEPNPTVVVAPVTMPTAAPDMAQQLAHLAHLHAAGALTDEEFSAAKSRLLS